MEWRADVIFIKLSDMTLIYVLKQREMILTLLHYFIDLINGKRFQF